MNEPIQVWNLTKNQKHTFINKNTFFVIKLSAFSKFFMARLLSAVCDHLYIKCAIITKRTLALTCTLHSRTCEKENKLMLILRRGSQVFS